MAFSLDDPVFRDFAFYSTASIAKMFGCTFLTVYKRLTTGKFANPEDKKTLSIGQPRANVDEDAVERVRRNHMNDMENIIPFILVGGFYVLTKPEHKTALLYFRIFFFSRIMHTLSYQAGAQPWRAIFFTAGLGPILSMVYHVIKATK